MLRLKTFEILAWSFALFAMPCMANEQTLDVIPNLSVDECTIEQNAERCSHSSFSGHHERGKLRNRCHKRRNRIKPLKLADFAGDWVIGVDSVGGVSGGATIGTSITIDGQFFFDQFGNGTANFFEGAIYAGTPGQVMFISASKFGNTITLSLTDPIHGIGTISFVIPSIDLIETVNFVTIRSKEDGSPIRLEGHPITASSTISRTASYTLRRQFH
jgi:hypothetical protein